MVCVRVRVNDQINSLGAVILLNMFDQLFTSRSSSSVNYANKRGSIGVPIAEAYGIASFGFLPDW